MTPLRGLAVTVVVVNALASACMIVVSAIQRGEQEKEKVRITRRQVFEINESGRPPRPGSVRDGWGNPIRVSCFEGQTSRACVIVSAGADGELEPETVALLETPSNAEQLRESAMLFYRSSLERRGAEARHPWYEAAKADVVFTGTTQLSGFAFDDSTRSYWEIPPNVWVHSFLLFGLPSLALFIAALAIARRGGVNDTASTKGRL